MRGSLAPWLPCHISPIDPRVGAIWLWSLVGLNSTGCGGEARLVTSLKGREPPLPSWAIAKTPCLQSMEYTVGCQ